MNCYIAGFCAAWTVIACGRLEGLIPLYADREAAATDAIVEALQVVQAARRAMGQ
jgi:hypothetical protein